VLPSRDDHPFCPQYVADVALGDGHLELRFEEVYQFLLGESRVLSLLLPQPGPTLERHLVRVTVAMVDERFPRRPSLTIATAEVEKRVPTEEKAQSLAEVLEILPLIEALEKLPLSQSSVDLTNGVAFHRNLPWLRWPHYTPEGAEVKF
jgi:hypothetical protein